MTLPKSLTRLVFIPLIVGVLPACAKAYQITMAPQQTSTDSFVIVQYTRSGGMKIWDCREVPEGKAWNPTCVRVEMKNSMREDAPE